MPKKLKQFEDLGAKTKAKKLKILELTKKCSLSSFFGKKPIEKVLDRNQKLVGDRVQSCRNVSVKIKKIR